jgi:hypothetical protein
MENETRERNMALSKLGRDGKIADDEYIYESKTVVH